MIEVRLADEIAGDGFQRIIELRAPAAGGPVDEMPRREIPDAAIPILVEGLVLLRGEKRRGADSLAAGPPEPIADQRAPVPVDRIIEAAGRCVPANFGRFREQALGRAGQPGDPPLAELP